MNDVSKIGFKAPFSRYDLYCIIGLFVVLIALITMPIFGLNIALHAQSHFNNNFELSLKKNKFFTISIDALYHALKANQDKKNYSFVEQFDSIKFPLQAAEKIQINIEILNNIEAKTLTSSSQNSAANHLNQYTTNSNDTRGAKILLIGLNQCGKSYLANQFSRSIKGLTIKVQIDANSFNKDSNHHSHEKVEDRCYSLANLMSDLIKKIENANTNCQKINLVFHIDEFDSKDILVDFNVDIAIFKQKIFDEIFDNQHKPHWLVPHLIITANNENKFNPQYRAGVTDETYTFLSRMPNRFLFKRLTLEEAKPVIADILAKNTVADANHTLADAISQKLQIILNNRHGNPNTLTMREITDAIGEVAISNDITLNYAAQQTINVINP